MHADGILLDDTVSFFFPRALRVCILGVGCVGVGGGG